MSNQTVTVRFRVALIYIFGISLLLLLLLTGIVSTAIAKDSHIFQITLGPSSQSTPEPTVTALEKEKLELEVEQLKIANANSERSLTNFRGWINLLYENITILSAIGLGLWAFFRYFKERGEELRNEEEQRFEAIVKSLGSKEPTERISAAALLPTFLRPEYERYFIQIFNLVAANLRKPFPHDIQGNTTSPATPSPFEQALIPVFREAYSQARLALYKEKKGKRKAEKKARLLKSDEVGKRLNAAGVQLDKAFLASADLEGSWLREASFQEAILTGAYFARANLEGSNMSKASLETADFSDANIHKVDFTEAKLEGATIEGIRFKGTIFKKAIAPELKMTNCKIEEAQADFEGADLSRAKFKSVNFNRASDVKRANIEEAAKDTKGANIEEAAELKDAEFIDVEGLSLEQITQCEKKGAIFKSDIKQKPATPNGKEGQ